MWKPAWALLVGVVVAAAAAVVVRKRGARTALHRLTGMRAAVWVVVWNLLGRVWRRVRGRHLTQFPPHPIAPRILDVEEAVLATDWEGSPAPLELRTASSRAEVRRTIEEGHALLRRTVASDAPCLTPFGRFAHARQWRDMVAIREGFARQMEEKGAAVVVRGDLGARPVVVAGLHRTGTTLLLNLLAQDPAARSPEMWEMMVPPARILAEGKAACVRAERASLAKAESVVPGYLREVHKFHHFDYDLPEEDCLLLRHIFPNPCDLWGFYGGGEVTRWFCEHADTLGTYQYRYLHAWLRWLRAEVPHPGEEHWVLKNPNHSFHLAALRREFPDADVVVTHRDPARAVASWAAMMLRVHITGLSDDCAPLDLAQYGRAILGHFVAASEALVRGCQQDDRIHHISFATLVADPIACIQSLYGRLGRPFTPAYRQRLERYLHQHARHKHGKAAYSLEDVGLSPALVQDQMQTYLSYFGSYL